MTREYRGFFDSLFDKQNVGKIGVFEKNFRKRSYFPYNATSKNPCFKRFAGDSWRKKHTYMGDSSVFAPTDF